MATVTVSCSDEEMRRLEILGKREGLTVEQMVRSGSTTSSASLMTHSVPLPSA
jgi:hypothetical protein